MPIRNAKVEDKRRRRTRMAIKTALLALLKDKPVSKITVSELADKACVNRKTFYNHYTDLNSVLREMEEEFLNDIFDIVDKQDVWKDIEDPSGFFERLFTIITENREVFTLLVESGQHVHLLSGFRRKLREVWGERLFQRENVDRERLTLLMDYVSYGVIALFESWAKTPGSISLTELAHFCAVVTAAATKPILDPMLEK